MKRPFAAVGFSLLLSIISSEALTYFIGKPILCISSVASAVIGILLVLFFLLSKKHTKYTALSVGIVLFCLIFGNLYWTVCRNLFDGKTENALSVEDDVYVISDEICKKTSSLFSTVLLSEKTGAKIQLFSYEAFSAEPGDIYGGEIKFSVSEEPSVYALSEEINLIGTAKGEINIIKADRKPFLRLIYRIREAIISKLKQNNGSTSGFLQAILLGDKSGLSGNEKLSLQRAGIYHVCAVSGLHVSILAAFVLLILNYFNIKSRWLKTVIIIPILLILTVLCGFTPSSVRAVFMTASALVAQSFFRRSDAVNSLGFALTVILLLSPFSAFSSSLLLSFSATFGIVTVAKPIKVSVSTLIFAKTGIVINRFFGNIVSWLALSLAATAFTVPITSFFFETSSACGLVANIFILFPATLLFISTILSVVFSFIPFCGSLVSIFSLLCRIGVKYIMSVSELFSSSVFADVSVSSESILCGLAVALVVGLTVYLKKNGKSKKNKRKRTFSAIASAVVAFFIVVFGGSTYKNVITPSDDLYHFSFIDVGQGMGSAVIYGDSAIVIDCGGTKNAAANMTDYLKSMGVNDIPCVIISHLHNDHANALEEFAGDWVIEEIIIPYTDGDDWLYEDVCEIAENEDAILTIAEEDSVRLLEDCVLSILTQHLDSTSDDENENSLVVIAKEGYVSAMFTGDITSKAEKRLVNEYGDLLMCDILGVPHHGSKYSSSELFLETVQPRMSIISVGENDYGHPTEEAMSRILACGSQILTTQNDGTIDVATDGQTIEISYGQ